MIKEYYVHTLFIFDICLDIKSVNTFDEMVKMKYDIIDKNRTSTLSVFSWIIHN